MDCCAFYGRSSRHTTVTLVSADPYESEGDNVSDPEEGDDADWVPPCEENVPPKEDQKQAHRGPSRQHSTQ